MLLTRTLLPALLSCAALLAWAGAVRADTEEEEEEAARKAARGDVILGGGLRVVVGHNPTEDPLMRYGYSAIHTYFDNSLAATFRALRLGKNPDRALGIDIGGRATWIFQTAGSSGADGSALWLHGLELMPVVRVLLRGRPWDNFGFGLELAGGVQIPWLVLRGQAVSHPSPAFAPSLVLYGAPNRWGHGFRFGYVVAGMNDAVYDKRLPTGGIHFSYFCDVMLGPSHR